MFRHTVLIAALIFTAAPHQAPAMADDLCVEEVSATCIASLDFCTRVDPSGLVAYAPLSIDVGTGEQSYIPDPIGSVDTKWGTGADGTGDAYSVSSAGAWVDSAISNWISTRADARTTGSLATYRIEFVTSPGTTYGWVNLRYAADNGVAFELNGIPIGGYPGGPTDSSAFTQMRNIDTPLMAMLPGTNVLEATVTDFGGVTGLIVEGAAHPCPVQRRIPDSACAGVDPSSDLIASAPLPVDVGTGEQAHVPDPIGSVDTKWRTGPTGGNPAYSISSAGAYYDSAISNWISTRPDARSTGSETAYRVEFVTSPGTSGWVDLRYAADNGVAFELNGIPIGGYPGGSTDSSAFTQMRNIDTPLMAMLPGTNVLEATVTDFGGYTGLIVEGAVKLCPQQRLTSDTD